MNKLVVYTAFGGCSCTGNRPFRAILIILVKVSQTQLSFMKITFFFQLGLYQSVKLKLPVTPPPKFWGHFQVS